MQLNFIWDKTQRIFRILFYFLVEFFACRFDRKINRNPNHKINNNKNCKENCNHTGFKRYPRVTEIAKRIGNKQG